jgi:hypothetical protein
MRELEEVDAQALFREDQDRRDEERRAIWPVAWAVIGLAIGLW